MRMKKFYLFLSVVLALSGLQAAHSQDSTGCNAAFFETLAGNTVNFRAADSVPGVRHNWYFGDGNSKSTDSFAVVHTYLAYGNYLVTHEVTDSVHHCRDSASQWVNVPAPGPSCGLYITEISDSLHHLYTFIANTSFSAGATDTVRWTVNDTLVGQGDTLKKYLPGGPYTVCALSSTSDGCQAESCVTVNPLDSVPPPPPDTCTIDFTAVRKDHKPNQYVFTVIDGSNYDPISWTIVGPDSLFAGPYHGPSFSYTFPDTGYYAVYVTGNKRAGCFVSNGQYIHIDSIPGPQGNYITSYPNPATTQVSLSVTLDQYTTIEIRVYNSMGGQVLSRNLSGYPGVNQITLPIATLPIGVYYIELQYGGTILRSKVQKL
jgi:hypothetical protein